MWYAEGVVASLTFHPVEKFLVIAKYNQLFFWDWENQEPKLKVGELCRPDPLDYLNMDLTLWDT